MPPRTQTARHSNDIATRKEGRSGKQPDLLNTNRDSWKVGLLSPDYTTLLGFACVIHTHRKMAPVHPFSLPLSLNGPPTGFGSSDRTFDSLSATTRTSVFNTGINQRDIFLGIRRCIICGIRSHVLEYCHIIPPAESERTVSRSGI